MLKGIRIIQSFTLMQATLFAYLNSNLNVFYPYAIKVNPHIVIVNM